jgi:hypothetical protein
LATNWHPRELVNEMAKNKMRTGEYLEAKNTLMLGLAEHGEHVELTIDLAGCYFRLGDYLNFQKWTIHSFDSYNTNKFQLSKKSDLVVRMKIARSLLELGRISQALPLLEFSERPLDDFSLMKYERIQCQLMHLYCLKRDLEKVAEQYVVLEQLNQKTLNSEIEVQQALMRADFILTGHQSANSRLQRVIERKDLNTSDYRWLVYDQLYDAIVSDSLKFFDGNLVTKLKYCELDPFEAIVHDAYLNLIGKPEQNPLNLSRTEGLNLVSALRILTLFANHFAGLFELTEIKNKMTIYLNQVDHRSKQVLLNSFQVKAVEKLKIFVDHDSLRCSEKKIKLTANEVHLIRMIQKPKFVSFEIASIHIFKLAISPSVVNRLRVLTARLNKKLRLLTNIESTIYTRNNNLIVQPQLSFESVG